MIFINGEPGKKTAKLGYLATAVGMLGLYGWFFYRYFQLSACSSEPKEPGILACLVVCFLFTCAALFFLYRSEMLTNFEVDGSGIRVLSGKKTKKAAIWQEFCYVGELKAFPLNRRLRFPRHSAFPQRIIVCSPEQPTLVYGYTDVYSFRGKGAIVIEYSPEAEQIMKPYYKGTLRADE